MCLVIPVESRRLRCPQGLPGASQCLFGDPEEIRRLIAHKVSQVTLYLSGASQCLFGDPEEIRRLNAHKVSQVTHYLSVIPVESRRLYDAHKVSQVHPSVCMCMRLFYICVLTCGLSLVL